MVVVQEQDNGRTVQVRVHDVVRIVLPENATTGYRWAVDRVDADLVDAAPAEPHYTDNAVGAGGMVAFLFRVRQAGAGKICLKHWRHWEGDGSIVARFCIHLEIRP